MFGRIRNTFQKGNKIKKQTVWVLLTSNVMMPEHDPNVDVFSSEEKMNKFVKGSVSKADFKEFKENGDVTTDDDTRYFNWISKVE